MPKYRVKLGYTHGAFDQHKAGTILEYTEQEAAGFLDKLEPVGVVSSGGLVVSPAQESQEADALRARLTELEAELAAVKQAEPPAGNGDTTPTLPTDFDVTGATVDEVLAAVKEGNVAAGDALIAEQQGKQRVSLLEKLGALVEAG
jgi:hypothetical protein